MAKAAELGGAKGLRIEGITNIKHIKKNVNLPIIGLIKRKINSKERYITPTLQDIDKILETKCDYIAIDYTMRDQIKNEYYMEITDRIHKTSNCSIVADISNLEEAKNAFDYGVDFISTTLRGYTKYTNNIKLPDVEFIKDLIKNNIINIIAEGGYSSHEEYIQALENGAKLVVIGTAITRPHLIVRKIITNTYF